MATKRMFNTWITNSDNFLDLPATTRLLYYDLNMNADDDGFVTPKKIMRMTGATINDLKGLVTSNLIIPFDSGVIVITHWRVHNNLRKDTYKSTIYQNEFKSILLNFINVYEPVTQIRLDQNSKEEVFVNSEELTSTGNYTKKNPMYKEDERKFSDDFIPVIDYETGLKTERPAAADKATAEMKANAKNIFDHYKSLYTRFIITDRPVFIHLSPKIRKLLYTALRRYGKERLTELLEAYINSDTPLFKKASWSIDVFLSSSVLFQLDTQTPIKNGTN
jgi:hypothetical protein